MLPLFHLSFSTCSYYNILTVFRLAIRSVVVLFQIFSRFIGSQILFNKHLLGYTINFRIKFQAQYVSI